VHHKVATDPRGTTAHPVLGRPLAWTRIESQLGTPGRREVAGADGEIVLLSAHWRLDFHPGAMMGRDGISRSPPLSAGLPQ